MKYIKFFESFNSTNPFIYDKHEFVKFIENIIVEDGTSFICTNVASAIRMLEGDGVKIYGFSTYENPSAEYFVEENGEDSDEGHHFAVLNDRYIIDPWIYDNYIKYPNTFDRSVFDLQNKNDNEIIKYVYGAKDKWVNITDYIDNECDFRKWFPHNYQKLIDFYNNIK